MDFDWMENTIFLRRLNDEERKLLSETLNIVEFEVGDNIVSQGQQGGTISIIRSLRTPTKKGVLMSERLYLAG